MFIEFFFASLPEEKIQTVFSFFFLEDSNADFNRLTRSNSFIVFFLFFLFGLDNAFVLKAKLFFIDLELIFFWFKTHFIDLALKNIESIQSLYKSLKELNWIRGGEELGPGVRYLVIENIQLAPSLLLILFLFLFLNILFVSSGSISIFPAYFSDYIT